MALHGKVVVITGASRGFGEALAECFSERGVKLVLAARHFDSLSKSWKEREALLVKCDVTDERQVHALAEAAISAFGGIDVWVNNAGVTIPHSSVADTDWKRAHDVMETNFFGLAYGCREAVRAMDGKGGVIVNIISTSALDSRPNSSAYAASKRAADALTKSLREEVRTKNILVIGVYPGGMRTHLFDEARPANYPEYMDPSEVAGQVVENLGRETPEEELVLRRK